MNPVVSISLPTQIIFGGKYLKAEVAISSKVTPTLGSDGVRKCSGSFGSEFH